MAKEFYELLGVDEDATEAVIKKAFRKKAKALHPDNKVTGDEDAYLEINRAYRILMDPDSRHIYDTTGNKDEESFKTAEELYMKVLVEAFDSALAGCGKELDKADLIEAMKIGMTESLKGVTESVANSTAIRDQLVRFRKRLGTRGHKKNVFLTTVDRHIEGRNKEIAHNSRAARILTLNLNELSYYRSPVDLMWAYGMDRDDFSEAPRRRPLLVTYATE